MNMQTLMTGLMFGESPRWHDGHLWFADWGTHEIIAVDDDGRSESVLRLQLSAFQPISIDWLRGGRLLIVSSRDDRLLRRELDGSLVTHADLSGLTKGWNEIVVDGRGNIYVNSVGFDMMTGEKFSPGIIVLVASDGSVRQVADGFAFANGMAVTPDNSTLIVAESYGKKLTAFDIAAAGHLSNRRTWADLRDGVPDGICIDAENAVWYADVPNKRCMRVREGGEILQTVKSEMGCFACMLGGPSGATLFVVTREWRGVESTTDRTRTGRLITMNAPAPHAGWP